VVADSALASSGVPSLRKLFFYATRVLREGSYRAYQQHGAGFGNSRNCSDSSFKLGGLARCEAKGLEAIWGETTGAASEQTTRHRDTKVSVSLCPCCYFLSGSAKTCSAYPVCGGLISRLIVSGTSHGLPPPRPVVTAMYCLPLMLKETGNP